MNGETLLAIITIILAIITTILIINKQKKHI